MRITLLLIISLFLSLQAKSQLVSYELIKSYTVPELVTLGNDVGFGILIQPEYEVDLYKVIYKTPYIHIDSLVNVSGLVVMPKGTVCPSPLAGYMHGTTMHASGVPSYLNSESNLGVFFASKGIVSALPDYLGLGDSDTSVIIHPYIHAFSQGHSSVNALRAARQLSDTLNVTLNGQLFLTGYSQGGFATVATHKLIEEEYSNEFTITASVAMSGAYDLKEAQVDQIVSPLPYATPGYLPYVLLAYHSVFPSIQQLYPDVSKVFKSPYDTLLPPLFYNKVTHGGIINGLCDTVPKNMLIDSLVIAFENDSLHPLRLALNESHLLDWAPQAPIRLLYCTGDDQVTYLNSERAFASWTDNGATQIDSFNFGDKDHNGCVQPAFINMAIYFQSLIDVCSGVEEITSNTLNVYPNPGYGEVFVEVPEHELGKNRQLSVYDLSGKQLMQIEPQGNLETINVKNLKSGIYIIEYRGETTYRSKLIVR